MQQPHSRKIERNEAFDFEFSFCTLMTNRDEYLEMQQSFLSLGFTTDICEYLYVDNVGNNAFEAYAGLNRFLREAKGKYVILCHQDILGREHDINHLRDKIEEMDQIDPRWAALGNAGGLNIKYRGLHLTNCSGKAWREADLPLKAATLDENFMVVKKSANLALSADLQGFHFYGTDICLIADVLGYNCYIIDYKLIHKSDGNDDKNFYLLKQQFIKKYARAFRSRFISSTITRFYLSGNKLCSWINNTSIVLFFARQFYKIFRPKKQYHIKLKG